MAEDASREIKRSKQLRKDIAELSPQLKKLGAFNEPEGLPRNVSRETFDDAPPTGEDIDRLISRALTLLIEKFEKENKGV